MTWYLVMAFCYAMAKTVAPFGRDRMLAAEYFEGISAGVVFLVWMIESFIALLPLRTAMEILFAARGWR